MLSVRKKANYEALRDHFPALRDSVYLDCAALGPLPEQVVRRGQELLQLMSESPVNFADSIGTLLQEARGAAAGFVGATPDDIAFVHSTSSAMTMVALRLRRLYKNRSEIVTLRDEFPATTLPFKRLGFTLRFVRPEAEHHYTTSEILRRISPTDTAAVVLSWVQFKTGARVDLPELAAELAQQRIPLFINATQAAGVLPVDVVKHHLAGLAFSSHKWMLAGSGGAVLYLPESMRGQGFPPLAGWLSTRDPFTFNNRQLFSLKEARAMELGFNSLVPLVCLAESIKLITSIGQVAIRDRVLDLTSRLIEGLKSKGARVMTPAPTERRAGIVGALRPDAEAWVQGLRDRGIIISQRGDDLVRISPHFYNTADEIERLVEQW